MTQIPSGRRRLALLPARGGSKRIPRKNIVDFHGRPIIAYAIDAAVRSGLFDRIHVSTDDDEIASVAARFGADADMRRPPELADDITPLLPVARWVLQSFEDAGDRFDDVFIVFPCSPLLEADDLRAGYAIYADFGYAKNLITVARAPAYPEWYFSRSESGALTPLKPGGSFIRGQDLEGAYYETGTFTIFSRDWLLNAGTLEDDTNYVSLELPSWKAVDIDEERDIEFAKMLYAARRT